MHTIDLLRGQGIPAKATPGSAAILVITVAVPFVVAIWMLDWYLQDRTIISIDRQAIAKEQATIDKLAQAVELKESLEKKRGLIGKRLSEVSSCIGGYIQWSPVLVTLVKDMPGKMVMSELSADSKSIRKTVPKDNDPNRPVKITVSQRTLALDITGNLPGNYDKIVKDYRSRLKSSDILASKLKDIIVSQKPGGSGDDKTVSYTMDFTFESGS